MKNIFKVDIDQYGPCAKGAKWYDRFDSSQIAWEECQRPDYMLWGADVLGVDKKKLILAASECFYEIRDLVPKEFFIYIDIFKKYAINQVGEDEFEKAKRNLQIAYDWESWEQVLFKLSKNKNLAWFAEDAWRGWSAWGAWDSFVLWAYITLVFCGSNASDIKKRKLNMANICRKHLTNAMFEKIKQMN